MLRDGGGQVLEVGGRDRRAWWLQRLRGELRAPKAFLFATARNAARDLDTTTRLTDEGWTVLRFWEHEDPHEVAATIIEVVHR